MPKELTLVIRNNQVLLIYRAWGGLFFVLGCLIPGLSRTDTREPDTCSHNESASK